MKTNEIPWYEVLHRPEPMWHQITNSKTALLTGGSRGIGAATRRLLEARGWTVIAPTRAELDFSPLSVESFIRRWMNSKTIDTPDALILCHGEWQSEPLKTTYNRIAIWFNQLATRVIFPAEFIDLLLQMPESKLKHVLMVSSTRGLIGGVNTAPYAAACAAQIALMQGYAREYAGVRFNVVCPGLTETLMGALVRATGGCKPDAVAQSPESVARVIVNLCEDGISNGKVVKVTDGVATLMEWGEV